MVLSILSNSKTDKIAVRCFWAVVSLHIIVWTTLPSIFRYALPKDALEGIVWGQQLQFGYDRNPWLNAWLTRFASDISGTSGWAIYLCSQLCVALAFWSVWRLGKKIFSPLHALTAVLMLEAIQYYTLAAIDFNDNVLELGLWPLLALLFYRAVTLGKLRDWLGVGIIAALALMAKYYTAIMLLSLLLFLLIDPQARQQFKNKNLYFAIIIFSLIIMPHIIWLFQHHFTTVNYAAMRVGENNTQHFWSYLKPTVKFGLMQVVNFIAAVILFSLLIWGKTANKKIIATATPVSSFNKRFLWIVGSGTFFITLLIAASTGWQLHTLWGTPLLSLWGLILLIYLQPNITSACFYRFIIAVFIVFIMYAIGYSLAITKKDNHSSANLPAKTISLTATKLWRQRYNTPLRYVAGDRYLAGYISYYSNDKPAVYMDWDILKSPWINEQQLRNSGAIFVQPLSDGKQFPPQILQRFPKLKVLPAYYFPRERATRKDNTVGILIGLLPPLK